MLNKGDKFGKYTIEKRIGIDEKGNSKGANATVYVVTYNSKQFVLKIPNNPERLDNLFREIGNWAKVSLHPNILNYYETVTDSGKIGFISEYIHSGSLNDWLKQSETLSLSQKLIMIDGILSGLEHLHANLILHRDLKPENVFVKENIPLLADFGSAKDYDFAEMQYAYGFTYKYAPPELVTLYDDFGVGAKYKITEFDDLWSVAIIICEILTGQYPFAGMSKIMKAELRPFPSNTEPNIIGFIQKSLQKERKNRFQTVKEMREALKNPQLFVSQENSDNKTIVDDDFDNSEILEIPLTEDWREVVKKNPNQNITDAELNQQKIIERERERQFQQMEAEKERQRIANEINFNQHNKPINLMSDDLSDVKSSDSTSLGNNAVLIVFLSKFIPSLKTKEISPRVNGIIDGIFLISLAFALAPTFAALNVVPNIGVPIISVILLIGILRIIYAFLAQSRKSQIISDKRKGIGQGIILILAVFPVSVVIATLFENRQQSYSSIIGSVLAIIMIVGGVLRIIYALVSQSSNNDLNSENVSDSLPQKQNLFRSLFNLESERFPIIVPILMWGLVGGISGIISKLLELITLSKETQILLVGLLFGITLFLFQEYSFSIPIRKRRKFFSSVILSIMTALGFGLSVYLHYTYSLRIVDSVNLFILFIGITWGIFIISAELILWKIKISKVVYSVLLIISLGSAFSFSFYLSDLLRLPLLSLILGEALIMLTHAIVWGIFGKEKKENVELVSEQTDILKIPKEINSISAIWGIGGVFLILIISTALMNRSSTPIGNSNSNSANTTNCSKFWRDPNSSAINLQPCKIGSSYGYSDPDGKIIIAPAYEDAGYFNSEIGLAKVKKSKWGFINTKGEVKIKFLYDNVEGFNNGTALATIGNEKFWIDANGKRIIQYATNTAVNATNTVANATNVALNTSSPMAVNTASNNLQSSSICKKGILNRGAKLRSTPYFPDESNVLSIWDKSGEVEVLGITQGQARTDTGNKSWYKVKIKQGNCDSSQYPDCNKYLEGYINADLIDCN